MAATPWKPIVGATCNLFISAAGAGLLSYPFATRYQGIGLNVGLTLAFAALNAWTDLLIGYFGTLHRRLLHQVTYEELCMRALTIDRNSKRGYWLAVTSVLIGCVGSILGFFIVIGDMGTPVFEDACSGSTSHACTIVSSRAFVTLLFAVVVALPLSFFERIHSLWISSLLAGASVLAVGVLVVTRGGQALADSTAAAVHPPPGTGEPESIWFRTGVTVFLGVPISVFSLGNHIQAVPLSQELPAAARRQWHVIIGATTALCLGLYLSTGVFGFLAFGDRVNGDVLVNFARDDSFANVAKALMVIHIALALPVIVVPCRRAMVMLAHMWLLERRRRAQRNSDGPAAVSTGGGDDRSDATSSSQSLLPSAGASGGFWASGVGRCLSACGAGVEWACCRLLAPGMLNGTHATGHRATGVSESLLASSGASRDKPPRKSRVGSEEELDGAVESIAATGQPKQLGKGGQVPRAAIQPGDAAGSADAPTSHMASALAELDELTEALEASDNDHRRCWGVACGPTAILQNAVLVLGGAGLALALPQLTVVFGLLGATVSVSQIHLFPAMMLLALAARRDAGLLQPDSNHSADGAGSSSEPLPTYVPTSSWWLRVQGWFLIAVAAFICIVGTATNVYSNFISS